MIDVKLFQKSLLTLRSSLKPSNLSYVTVLKLNVMVSITRT